MESQGRRRGKNFGIDNELGAEQPVSPQTVDGISQSICPDHIQRAFSRLSALCLEDRPVFSEESPPVIPIIQESVNLHEWMFQDHGTCK